MTIRITHKGKTLRAFRAYLDLLDAADWLRGQLRGPLEAFDLTMGGFRLLELLYREGPMSMRDVVEKRQNNRQNLSVIIARLQERGWARWEVSILPPAKIRENHLPKARRGKPRTGRRAGIVRLTPLGEKFIGTVFPKHASVVKGRMRVLHGREQVTLSRLCRKVREGDLMKYLKEMLYEYEDE
jgi:DNA-binding MarR family transcriptional regulator